MPGRKRRRRKTLAIALAVASFDTLLGLSALALWGLTLGAVRIFELCAAAGFAALTGWFARDAWGRS